MPGLLPQTILPPSEPLDAAGRVTISKNWWLFFYNLTKQTIGVGGGPPAGGTGGGSGGSSGGGSGGGGLIEQYAELFAASQSTIDPDTPQLTSRVGALEAEQFREAPSGADIAKLSARIVSLELSQRPPDVTPSPQAVRDATLLAFLTLSGS